MQSGTLPLVGRHGNVGIIGSEGLGQAQSRIRAILVPGPSCF
jgi:hypothetical protein